MGRTWEYLRVFTMRAAIVIAACLAVASARTFSKKALSTPLARGGGRIVGGTDAYPGEFPHQIMLTRGVGGSLMCGGSIVGSNKVITAGHCCDGMSASKLELRLEATTCTRTIRTRSLLPCPTVACTRTTTAGTSTTTFACSLLRAQSAWDPTLEQLACPPAWKSTPRAPSAPFPDGEPPLRVEALPVFSRRSTSLSCLTSIAVTPTDSPKSLTP